MLEQKLRELMEKFNRKVSEDEKLQKELEGKNRSFLLELKEGKTFSWHLRNGKIEEFNEGKIENPDVRVISDEKTIMDLFEKKMGPMKALATKKLVLKGKIDDLLQLKKFFFSK